MGIEILYIIFGWFLGLLSPIVSDDIRRRVKMKKLKEALIKELSSIEKKLLAGSYHMTSRIGNFDKEYMLWFIPLFKKYRKYSPDVSVELDEKGLEKLYEAIMNNSDESMRYWEQLSKSYYKGGIGLKKFHLPLLKSVLNNIQYIDSDFAQRILKILDRLEMINEDIDGAREFLKMTYDASIDPKNYDIVNYNKDIAYKSILEQENILIKEIDLLVSRYHE